MKVLTKIANSYSFSYYIQMYLTLYEFLKTNKGVRMFLVSSTEYLISQFIII